MSEVETQAKIRELVEAGVGRFGIEGVIGHKFTEDELAIYREIYAAWRIAEAKRKAEKRSGKIDQVERMRRIREAENEIKIPPCKDPERRKKAEKDLVLWLTTYCMEDGGFLAYPPSKELYPIIRSIDDALTKTGWYHERMPRGIGKTSYVKGGVAKALSSGDRKYVVAVAAASDNASGIIRDIFALFERGKTFGEDYPEIAVPIRALHGKTQRAKSLTIGGKPCAIKVNAQELNLPKADGYPSSGGILKAIGFSGNARGMVKGSLRPDLVVFDDLQNEDMAKSPERVAAAVLNIEKNFLNLGGHTKSIAALMTSTPIEPDDLSETFAKKETWFTSTYPLIKKFPQSLNTLWEEYRAIRRHERFLGKPPHKECNKYYRAHRAAMDRGCIVLTPDNYDRKLELSGIQHAMNLYFNGEEQFMSEYQMQPKRQQLVFELTPQIVMSRARADWQPLTIPDEAVMTVLSTDLNPAYGYSSAMTAFDRFATGTIPWYGIFKTSIHKERMTEAEYRAAIYNELVNLGRDLVNDLTARNIKLDYWAIDAGGDQFDPVMRFWRNAKELGIPFEIVPMIGRAGKTWNPFVRSRIKSPINETVECGDRDRDGNKQRWVYFNADYWRETQQRAWVGNIGTPGGLSLFGDKKIRHDEFAEQVAAEKLISKTRDSEGRLKYEWRGGETKRHDYGDAATMCLAVAANKGLTQGVEYVGKQKKSTKVIMW